MKSVRSCIFMLVGLFAGSASAVIPDSGWYWNPNESGRGFNIEIQNNILVMAGFIYDTTGKPVWATTGGQMSSDHTYSGTMFLATGGQPLGGAYRAATNVPFGGVTITWVNTVNANVTINGYSFTLTRQLTGVDFTNVAQPLQGEFSFVEGSGGIFFGDRIILTGTSVLNGSLYAVGHKTGDVNRIAVGSYAPSLNQWTILLDSSTSYYDFYVFTFEGVNLVEGTDSTYLKGSSPSGGLSMVGFRTKSSQAAAGLDAPGTTKAAQHYTDEHFAAKQAAQTAAPLSAAHLEKMREMERWLTAR